MWIDYELIGAGAPGGRSWVITPGGRFSKDSPGVRELATALAGRGNRVLIWDRPNCGASDVCFTGPSESAMQADILATLLADLNMAPAVIAGGSGGSRVSLLTAARHPEVAAGLAMWWISGGVYGLMILGVHYCGGSLTAAWNGGMEAVAKLPEWAEVLERNPANRDRFLAQDPGEFIATMERWMAAYCPCGDELVPGLPDEQGRRLDVPALVFRSGASDFNHTRATSEQLARLLPNARLVEPPWGDNEWNERSAARPGGRGEGLFVGWPRLAPALQAWADEVKPVLPGGGQGRDRAAEHLGIQARAGRDRRCRQRLRLEGPRRHAQPVPHQPARRGRNPIVTRTPQPYLGQPCVQGLVHHPADPRIGVIQVLPDRDALQARTPHPPGQHRLQVTGADPEDPGGPGIGAVRSQHRDVPAGHHLIEQPVSRRPHHLDQGGRHRRQARLQGVAEQG